MSSFDRFRNGVVPTESPVPTALPQENQAITAEVPYSNTEVDPLGSSMAGAIMPDPNEPTRMGAIQGAFQGGDNLVGAVLNFGGDQYNRIKSTGNLIFDEVDPKFSLADHTEAFDTIAPEFWDELQSAKNDDHFYLLANKYQKLSDKVGYLDSLGIEGIAYRTSAFMFDAPFISWPTKLAKVGRMGSLLQTMSNSYKGRVVIAGVTEGTIEGVKQVIGAEDRSEMDLLLAIGLGGTLGGLYNPKNYSDEVGDVIQNIVKAQLDEVATTGKMTVPERIIKMVEDSQFSAASMFKRSPSPTMNAIGDKLFPDFINLTTVPKASELQTQVRDNVIALFNDTYNPLMYEYLETVYGMSRAQARFAMQKQDEFYNIVGGLHYGDDALRKSLPEGFAKKLDAAKAKMSSESFKVLERSGHPKFTDGSITQVEDWMPRRWNTSKLIEDINLGKIKKSDLVAAVASKMRSRRMELGLRELDEAETLTSANSFVNRLTKPQVEVGDKDFLLSGNSFKGIKEDLKEMLNLSDEELLSVEQLLDATKKKPTDGIAASTKHRTAIDMETPYITADGVEIKLNDYVQRNVQTVWSDYARSMGGDTALRSVGLNSRAEVQAMRKQIEKELTDEAGNIPANHQVYLDNVDAVLAEFLGMSTKADPSNAIWKGIRVSNNLVRAAKLGFTWAALAAEMFQVTHRVGTVNLIRALPALRQVGRKLQGKNADEVYDEIRTWEALGHELHSMPSSAKWDDTYLGHSGIQGIDKAERVSDVLAEATYLAGGVKSGTAALEHLFAVANRIKMTKMAQKGTLSKNDRWYFKQFGFDDETTDAIVTNIRKFGEKGNQALLNLDQWDNNLGHRWSLGVRRQSHILVQRGDIGDQFGRFTEKGRLAKDTYLGNIAMNLRSYMLLAWSKQFGRGVANLARGGDDAWDTFSNWSMQTAVMSLAYMGKQYANNWNDPEKLEAALTPQRIAAGTLSMTTYASILPNALDVPFRAITGEGLSGGGARGGELNPLGATGGYLFQELPKAFSTAVGLVSPYNDVSSKQIQSAVGTFPLTSNPLIRNLTKELADALEEK
jgi:hypothetical protein